MNPIKAYLNTLQQTPCVHCYVADKLDLERNIESLYNYAEEDIKKRIMDNLADVVKDETLKGLLLERVQSIKGRYNNGY